MAFDFDKYIADSTNKSGVPLKVQDAVSRAWLESQLARAPKLSPKRWRRIAAILGGKPH